MTKLAVVLVSVAVLLLPGLPAGAQGPMGPPPGPQFERGMGGPMGPGHGYRRPGMEEHHGHMGEHPGHMGRQGPMGRPLISIMLRHRDELGLSAAQVESLENLRSDFMREAIRRQADLRIARLDLFDLMRADRSDPTKAVDLAKVEGKIREIEKIRADLRVARVRTIEAGKAQLTADQKVKFAALMAQSRGRWPQRGPQPPAPSRS